jgi:Cd2+/Zn2+-exporting ATPase
MAHSFVKDMIETETHRFRIQMIVCLAGGFVLTNSYLASRLYGPEIAAMLAMGAALLLGAPLVVHALTDLLSQSLELNELAALSFVAAFCTAQYQVAAVIALFMVVSQLIEFRSQLGARRSIEALLRLAPKRVLVERSGELREIDADRVRPGEYVHIRPGDGIPGDGVVEDGFSTVNESALTGESLPVAKRTGDRVYAGSVNESGLLKVRIATEIQDSTLEKIKEMILRAEQSRTPSMRIVDRYARWYTPLILSLAGVVLFFTHDMSRAIAMLVVACPCTIVLSGPSALVAALSAAARVGVIVKDIAALEQASRVDTVVFDKTGTLTTGRLGVETVHTVDGLTRDELLTMAATVESASTHPVAKAVVREAGSPPRASARVEFICEEPGMGVRGTVDGVPVCVGRGEWVIAQCSYPMNPLDATIDGASAVYVAKNGKFAGIIYLSDTIKTGASAIVEALGKEAIDEVIMLTGDKRAEAQRVAAAVGCEVIAEVLPGDKQRTVNELKRSGKTVAVIGDGVNDAPALAAGDVSIAMGAAGSEVAIHSASVVLMNDRLDRLPFIFRLSRRVVDVIRQNLAFSLVYIAVLLGLSASGVIPPILGVILHTASTVFIILNSARLLRTGEGLA